MKILTSIGVTLLAASLLVGGFMFYTKTSHAEEFLLPYQYELVSQSQDPILEPAQAGLLVATIKNTGIQEWPISGLVLKSIYFDGTASRPSSFTTSAWGDQTDIPASLSSNETIVRPNGTITFYVPIQAVKREAVYQETFQPYTTAGIITGAPIKWLIQVGNKLSYQVADGKQIRIWLSDQKIWAIENGVVIMETPISTGRAGYATPKGNYTIFNHKETAYSAPYQLWMDYWMALKNSYGVVTGHGLHRLPYWKVKQGNRVEGEIKNGRLYTNGKLYENYAHLGKPMSHGCIRLGLETSRILYYWAPNGTPVIIA